MDHSHSGIDFSPPSYSPITFKQCVTELKRQGLERLLTAVYQREVSVNLLLVECGASQAVLEALRYRNTSAMTEMMIDQLRALVSQSEGGERRYQIIERYYGLDGNMPARLSAMATKHNVSRERIRQIKERSLVALRYKKQQIERMLLSLSMRVVSRKGYGLQHASNLCVSEPKGFKLFDHRTLLLMHEQNVSLTEEQTKALFDLNWAKRAKITGCAGSGKTWLAISTARRLAESGERTLLTCFSRALADHLEDLLKDVPNLVVTSYHALCLRMAKQAGLTVPGGWNNRAWLEKFPDVLQKAMVSEPDLKFNAIIVDDAQDFRLNWWHSLEASMVDPEHGRLFYFVDDNQLKDAGHSPPAVDIVSHLSINLRSPALISSILSASYSAKHPMRFTRMSSAPVEFYKCDNDDEVQQTLSHVFSDLVDKGSFLATDVAIITHRLPRLSAAFKARLKGNSRIVRRQSDVPNHAILSRCHTFQGLESRVVIVIDLDNRFVESTDDELKSFVYMTFSRFVDKLVILGCADAWNRIDALIAPKTPEPSVMPSTQWLEKAVERVTI